MNATELFVPRHQRQLTLDAAGDNVAQLDHIGPLQRAVLDGEVQIAGFDAGLPVPLRARRRDGGAARLADAKVTGLNDQHAYLRLDPGTALAPGDVVCLGISHPCTTLDKWRLITVLDDEDNIIDTVHTFF